MGVFEYTTKTVEDVLRDLKGSENGLSDKEAEERQREFGFNEIKVKETGLFDILIRQFKSPFFYLLLVAAFVALFAGERVNALLIMCFVVINTVLGFLQETRAVKAAAILKKYIPLKARVKRGGREKLIEQKFLVPGDIVMIEAGNIVPADLRLIKTKNLLIDEEVLSGESVPVSKDFQALYEEAKEIFQAKNVVFMASSVISGKAEGVVIGTGKGTFFGEVAKLTTETVRESVYEKDIVKLSRIILRIVVASIILVFFANLIIKDTTNFFSFLIFCIALIVSIIPEALPLVITFALSNGALKLAKDKVVVKRLSAIEDLGDIEILCSDKTGTLTENKLFLNDIFSPEKERCLLYGLLSSSLMKEEIESAKNPFDVALWEKASPETRDNLSSFSVIGEILFDNERLRNSVLVENEGKKTLIVKGAPEIILSLSSNIEGRASQIEKSLEKEGKEGKRVLAVAFKDFNRVKYSESDERNLKFLGYFSFVDPLKKTAKPAVQLAEKLNVQIKILTGDTPDVAGAVAKEIGLIKDAKEVIIGEKLESFSKEEFAMACEKFNVFARTSPKTKFKIVEALQKKFEVGFLGEGINDAPSLKIANVAIAVREGADISREVSDIILLRKDLRVVVNGIESGRNVFSNINKYIKCTLASNFGNFYSIAAISLFIPFLPMLPIQILLVNLLTDFPLIAIVSDKVDTEELRKPKVYQLNKIIWLIVFLAMTSTIFDFIFFFLFHKSGESTLRTLWFIESVLTEIVLIFSIRTRFSFFKTKAPSLPLIVFSLSVLAITITLPFTAVGKDFFQFVPPRIFQLLVVLSLILNYFIISEAVKLFYFRNWDNKLAKKSAD